MYTQTTDVEFAIIDDASLADVGGGTNGNGIWFLQHLSNKIWIAENPPPPRWVFYL